ncbi:hypothetical protein BAE44_0020486 [Dichanthelium oligosanthes]|uniref:Uncharacterized protein n=1 Tax=Dichanthelium oligosanthes TaxID=888268 RepID=A0A1E5V021_9POAL|nr:hypothetical protein BAE44_0020486 [Dichanthelium oligosanthes]
MKRMEYSLYAAPIVLPSKTPFRCKHQLVQAVHEMEVDIAGPNYGRL